MLDCEKIESIQYRIVMQEKLIDRKSELWEAVRREAASLGLDAQGLFDRIPSIEDAFATPQPSVRCVDEGVVGGIHLPGSGVLLSPEKLPGALLKAGIREITTHDGCGAFALGFPNEIDPNNASVAWGKRVAEQLGLSHRHITADEMDRPRDLHTAVAVYYDGTGNFNRVEGLPRGFVVSRRRFDSGPEDLQLCLKIALGGHGFGELFSEETPLSVVLLEDPKNPAFSLDVLREEAGRIVSPFGNRVKVLPVKTARYIQ